MFVLFSLYCLNTSYICTCMHADVHAFIYVCKYHVCVQLCSGYICFSFSFFFSLLELCVTKKSIGLWQVLFYALNLIFQKQRWSRHTFARLLLLQSILERDNGRQESDSAGVNDDSAYFQPAACLGQQGLGV